MLNVYNCTIIVCTCLCAEVLDVALQKPPIVVTTASSHASPSGKCHSATNCDHRHYLLFVLFRFLQFSLHTLGVVKLVTVDEPLSIMYGFIIIIIIIIIIILIN